MDMSISNSFSLPTLLCYNLTFGETAAAARPTTSYSDPDDMLAASSRALTATRCRASSIAIGRRGLALKSGEWIKGELKPDT